MAGFVWWHPQIWLCQILTLIEWDNWCFDQSRPFVLNFHKILIWGSSILEFCDHWKLFIWYSLWLTLVFSPAFFGYLWQYRISKPGLPYWLTTKFRANNPATVQAKKFMSAIKHSKIENCKLDFLKLSINDKLWNSNHDMYVRKWNDSQIVTFRTAFATLAMLLRKVFQKKVVIFHDFCH